VPAITAWANDDGYENVYSSQLERFASQHDMLFAISSSGRSANIINAAETALEKNMTLITLSGFDADNPLSRLGNYNIHVPSHRYGLVEVAHHAILHHILDRVIDG
jgi:D-sedoheptulose 7-phosphate isomerase